MEQVIPIPVSKNLNREPITEVSIFICKVCGTQMSQKDKCLCRPNLCYRCCKCGLDCDACNCSVKSNWGMRN